MSAITAIRSTRMPLIAAARGLVPAARSSKPAAVRRVTTMVASATRPASRMPACTPGGPPIVGSSAPSPTPRVAATPAAGSDHTSVAA